MTAAEITERQVIRVRELTNLTAEQCSRELIAEMLKDDYPRDAAVKLLQVNDILVALQTNFVIVDCAGDEEPSPDAAILAVLVACCCHPTKTIHKTNPGKNDRATQQHKHKPTH